MSYLYRYVEPIEEKIKYVGIIYGENRTLKQRVDEHFKNDSWCWNAPYEIEYIECSYSRTDLEYIESHLISLYGTDKYFNKSKTRWGTSTFIPNLEDRWQYYTVINVHLLDKQLESLKIEIENGRNKIKFYQNILDFMKCHDKQIQSYRIALENN